MNGEEVIVGLFAVFGPHMREDRILDPLRVSGSKVELAGSCVQ